MTEGESTLWMCWYFSLCSFTDSPSLFFRDMLRFLSDEQYDDVILVAEMIPYIEVVVKPRGTYTLLIFFCLTRVHCNIDIREVKIDVYGRPVTANAKLQVEFEGKFYKFLKVSTSF